MQEAGDLPAFARLPGPISPEASMAMLSVTRVSVAPPANTPRCWAKLSNDRNGKKYNF